MLPIEIYNDELRNGTFNINLKTAEIEEELEMMQDILANNSEYNQYKFDFFHDGQNNAFWYTIRRKMVEARIKPP